MCRGLANNRLEGTLDFIANIPSTLDYLWEALPYLFWGLPHFTSHIYDLIDWAPSPLTMFFESFILQYRFMMKYNSDWPTYRSELHFHTWKLLMANACALLDSYNFEICSQSPLWILIKAFCMIDIRDLSNNQFTGGVRFNNANTNLLYLWDI